MSTDELLDDDALARRWGMSTQTLQNWRVQGKGPQYIKMGEGKSSPVMYRIKDVLEWEEKHLKGGDNAEL